MTELSQKHNIDFFLSDLRRTISVMHRTFKKIPLKSISENFEKIEGYFRKKSYLKFDQFWGYGIGRADNGTKKLHENTKTEQGIYLTIFRLKKSKLCFEYYCIKNDGEVEETVIEDFILDSKDITDLNISKSQLAGRYSLIIKSNRFVDQLSIPVTSIENGEYYIKWINQIKNPTQIIETNKENEINDISKPNKEEVDENNSESTTTELHESTVSNDNGKKSKLNPGWLILIVAIIALFFGQNLYDRFFNDTTETKKDSKKQFIESSELNSPESIEPDTFTLEYLEPTPILDKNINIEYHYNDLKVSGINSKELLVNGKNKFGDKLKFTRRNDAIRTYIYDLPFLEMKYKEKYYSLEVIGKMYDFKYVVMEIDTTSIQLYKFQNVVDR